MYTVHKVMCINALGPDTMAVTKEELHIKKSVISV